MDPVLLRTRDPSAPSSGTGGRSTVSIEGQHCQVSLRTTTVTQSVSSTHTLYPCSVPHLPPRPCPLHTAPGTGPTIRRDTFPSPSGWSAPTVSGSVSLTGPHPCPSRGQQWYEHSYLRLTPEDSKECGSAVSPRGPDPFLEHTYVCVRQCVCV